MVTQDQKVTQGKAIDLQVIGQDEDGDDLTYRWYRSRDGINLKDAGFGDSLAYHGDLSPGKHYFLCEVSDGKDNTTSDLVTITIEVETPGPSTGVVMIVLLAMSIVFVTARRGCLEH